jgi:heme-degrading monooxygenase HmoA
MNEGRFARVITMKARRGKGRAFRRTFEDRVVPTARELGGLRRLYLLREVGKPDEFAVISLWDSKGDAERYAKSGRNRVYARDLAAVQSGKEKVRKFEVVLHVVGESAGSGKARESRS